MRVLLTVRTPGQQREMWLTAVCGVGLVLLFAVLLWVCAPSRQHQNWDSLSYSSDADSPDAWAIIGNHPLTHMVWRLVMDAARAAGYEGRALPVLILVNCFLSGVTVGLLFYLLRVHLRCPLSGGLGLASLFGSTAVMMRYSGSADIYSLSVLASALVWVLLVRCAMADRVSLWRWAGVGAASGVAVLAHQVHVLLVPIAAWAAWVRSSRRTQATAACLLTAGAVGGLGYLLAAHLTIGTASLIDLRRWFSGYVGVSSYGLWLSPRHIPRAVSALGLSFLAFGWGGLLPWARAVLFGLLLLLPVVSIVCRGHRDRRRGLIVGISLFQIMGTWGLLQWHEPWTEKFWLLAHVPFIVLLGALWGGGDPDREMNGHRSAVWRAAPSWLALVLVGTILAFNVWTRGIPQRCDTDEFVVALETWVAHTQPGDLIVTAGDLTHHLRFLENRPYAEPMDSIVRSPEAENKFAFMQARISEAFARGDNVWVAGNVHDYLWTFLLESGNISRAEIKDFFDQYEREAAFVYRNDIDGRETQVYRLTGGIADG